MPSPRRAPKSPPSGRARTGRLAEDLAVRFLIRRGARITARNVKVGRGELDILAVIEGTRAAIEVRSLSGRDPLESFDEAKADQVWNLARSIVPPADRVDLIAVRFEPERVEIRWVPDIS